jgi:Domain of unknown function (DUF6265)
MTPLRAHLPLFLTLGLCGCAITFPPPGGGPASKPPPSLPSATSPSTPGSSQNPVSIPTQPGAGSAGQGSGTANNGQVVVNADLGQEPYGAVAANPPSAAAAQALAARPAPSPALLPLEWFQGQWVASSQGKGGVAIYRIESYGPIVGGVLLGTYLEVEGGLPKMYELIAIESTPAGVDLCMRHFSAGLVPWKSEAQGPQRYRLMRANSEEAVFERQPSAAGQVVDPEHARMIYRRQGERLSVRLENLDQSGALNFEFQRVP